eukprot:scaffold19_cov114-Cylindrotheca_fusiformis.AAC.30
MTIKRFLLSFTLLSVVVQPLVIGLSIVTNSHDAGGGKPLERNRRRQVLQSVVAVASATSIPMPAFAESDLSSFQDGSGGIKYSILREGSGDKPQRAQKVYTKYTLWTGGFGDDGKQVDSNTGFLGRPLGVIVGVGQVIKGWDLELLDMKVGEIRRMAIPSDLGYGDKGAGGSIPPKATLFFEVELASMDPMIQLNEEQKKWLDEHPL